MEVHTCAFLNLAPDGNDGLLHATAVISLQYPYSKKPENQSGYSAGGGEPLLGTES